MPASGITDELTGLEQARSRLEVALSDDENWRALRQSDGSDDEGLESAVRQARNTRLEMALAENPLYLAWKHLGEAIGALQGSTGAEQPALVDQHANEPTAASSELPPGIAELLHRNVARDAARAADGSSSREVEADSLDSTGDTDGSSDDASSDDQNQAAPAPVKLPSKPASSYGRPVGRNATINLDGGASSHPRRRVGTEPDEATVAFVRRKPLLPSAQLPADLGTERDSKLFERLRSLSTEQAPAETPYSPSGGGEEAEVVIVTPEGARARREAEARAGTVRRLRKALSGD